MNLSMTEIQHIVERKAVEDADWLKKARESGIWLLDDVRALSTEELVERTSALGFAFSKSQLATKVRKHPSSEALFLDVIETMPNPPEGRDEDFAWLALTVLWERWFPDVVNAEMLDDSMQKGYDLISQGSKSNPAPLEIGIAEWERTWYMAKDLATRYGTLSVDAFDDKFGGTQTLFNWSQDFDMELENAETFGVKAMSRQQYHTEFDRVFPLSAGHPKPRYEDFDPLASSDSVSVAEPSPAKRRKIGRNEPCPCGSGKKYKRCCGR